MGDCTVAVALSSQRGYYCEDHLGAVHKAGVQLGGLLRPFLSECKFRRCRLNYDDDVNNVSTAYRSGDAQGGQEAASGGVYDPQEDIHVGGTRFGREEQSVG